MLCPQLLQLGRCMQANSKTAALFIADFLEMFNMSVLGTIAYIAPSLVTICLLQT